MTTEMLRPLVSRLFANTRTRQILLFAITFVTVFGLSVSVYSSFSSPFSSSVHIESVRKELLATQLKPRPNNPSPSPLEEPVTSFRRSSCRSSSFRSIEGLGIERISSATWGPRWTVDSNGGVCQHGELQSNGCCPPPSTVQVQRLPLIHPKSTDSRRSPLSVSTDSDSQSPTDRGSNEMNDSNDSMKNTLDDAKKEIVNDEPSIRIQPSCSTQHQCCAQYEYCVSSCLEFTWQRLHRFKIHESQKENVPDKPVDSIERLVASNQAGDSNVRTEYVKGTDDLFDWCVTRCRTSGRSVVHQNSFRSSLKYCYGLKDPPLLARNIQTEQADF